MERAYTRRFDAELALIEFLRNETVARHLIFPPDKTANLSASLPLEQYAGTYVNPGYGEYVLEYENGTLWNHMKRGPVIQWDAKLEHISGDHFFAVGYGKDSPEDPVYLTAEFVVGVDGKVKRFGALLEPAMAPERVWFENTA